MPSSFVRSSVVRPMILLSLSSLSRSYSGRARGQSRTADGGAAALRNRRIKAEIDDGEGAEVEAANRRSQ